MVEKTQQELEAILSKLRQFKPDETVEGNPLYTLMIVEDGQNTGQYGAIVGLTNPIPLFSDKSVAEDAANWRQKSDPAVQVRGLSKDHLRWLLYAAYSFNWDLALILRVLNEGQMMGSEMVKEDTYRLYFPGENFPDGTPVPMSACGGSCGDADDED